MHRHDIHVCSHTLLNYNSFSPLLFFSFLLLSHLVSGLLPSESDIAQMPLQDWGLELTLAPKLGKVPYMCVLEKKEKKKKKL